MRSVSRAPAAKSSRTRRGKSSTRKGEPRFDARGWVFGSPDRAGDGPVRRYLRHLQGGPWHRRPMLIVTAVLLVFGTAAGILAGGHIAATFRSARDSVMETFASAGFAVSEIDIRGNERTSADAVYAALGVENGESIFAADPAGARARLMALPWIADAVVRRHFPGTVSVAIIEKRPFALWQNGESLQVVERSGAVITQANVAAFAKLPILLGAGAPEAAAPLIDALGPDRAVQARLKAIERISERRWDLILDRGVRIKLPEKGWEAELADLEHLIVDKGVLERDIEMIDLRYPDQYIFQLHNGDSRPVSRERPA